MRRRWTEAERRVLRAEFEAGASAQAIARHLGRTVSSVQEQAWAQGLHWREQKQARALALADVGAALNTLADEIEAALREQATAPLFRPGERF